MAPPYSTLNLPNFDDTQIAFQSKSDAALWRAVMLFRLIGITPIVKIGPSLVNFGFKAHLPIKPLVRSTVFRQFCGGESLDECRETIDLMAGDGVSAILDYGVEGEKSERGFDAAVAEILRTVGEASGNKNIPFCVFKMTALARFELLEHVSNKGESALSPEEAQEYARVKARVDRICSTAADQNLPVMIDAEETWIQPAIDAIAESLMQKHNQQRALVYTTAQMYRVDRLNYIRNLVERASREGWHVGIKLVRGAYMEKERERAQAMNYPSPIHPNKKATDQAYDDALSFCVASLNHVAICAGTHNESSCLRGARLLAQYNVLHRDPRVWFSQLYGMSDHISYNLAHCGYPVAKYVPYGPVAKVLPYLFRRAQENTSVAGQSSRELQLVERELKRRRIKAR